MDKLSIASQSRESIFPSKGLFQRFSSEVNLLLLNFHKRRWERYERLVDGMRRKGLGNTTKPEEQSGNELNISKSIVEAVSLGLHAFEQGKGFLSTEVSLNSLAMEINTNSSYLSKIINHTKQKSFKKYLNDLRVAYAYEELQTNLDIRKYTMEAIANDFGFKSAENFSKKFCEVYGMYPSKFLKKFRT